MLNGVVNYEYWLPTAALAFPSVGELISRYQSQARGTQTDALGYYVAPCAYAQLQVVEQAIRATGALVDAELAEYTHGAVRQHRLNDIEEFPSPDALLSYYLQGQLGYSPIQSGLAFLPMVIVDIVISTTTSAVLLGRTGPRPLVVAGKLVTGAGLALPTRLGLRSSYASDVLPPLLLIGAGIGCAIATAINAATAGIAPVDSGIASALVNTSQQVGGSVGTALLNTLATTAAVTFARTPATGADVPARATIHGNAVAFWTGAGISGLGALVCGSLLRPRIAEPSAAAHPVLAHHWSLACGRSPAVIPPPRAE